MLFRLAGHDSDYPGGRKNQALRPYRNRIPVTHLSKGRIIHIYGHSPPLSSKSPARFSQQRLVPNLLDHSATASYFQWNAQSRDMEPIL
jgi:hypothetical protein